MNMRLVALLCTVSLIPILQGCATRFIKVNAEVAESGEEWFKRLQQLRRDMPYQEVFSTLHIKDNNVSWMTPENILNSQTGVKDPRNFDIKEAEAFTRTHPGLSLQFQKIYVVRSPQVSKSGIIGIRERQDGPDQRLEIIFSGCTQITFSTCVLYDARLSGPYSVNKDQTQWIWSLLPMVIESGVMEAVKQGAKAVY